MAKLTALQKSLIVRWLNAAGVWSEQLTTLTVMKEMYSGVLLAQILHS